jgi:hypothetical protein
MGWRQLRLLTIIQDQHVQHSSWQRQLLKQLLKRLCLHCRITTLTNTIVGRRVAYSARSTGLVTLWC